MILMLLSSLVNIRFDIVSVIKINACDFFINTRNFIMRKDVLNSLQYRYTHNRKPNHMRNCILSIKQILVSMDLMRLTLELVSRCGISFSSIIPWQHEI
jgi:hypothetical protein